jgi:hypothetical protein
MVVQPQLFVNNAAGKYQSDSESKALSPGTMYGGAAPSLFIQGELRTRRRADQYKQHRTRPRE